MAKANAKKVVKRRRERKNIEKGAAHIRSCYILACIFIFRSSLMT